MVVSIRRMLASRGSNAPGGWLVLVVHLDRVLADPVLDPHPFLALLYVADHLGQQARRDVAVGRHLATQEAHHVWVEEGGQAVMDQCGVLPG